MSGANGDAGARQRPILVVDSDDDQRSFIRNVLSRRGFRIRALATGREALRAAAREQPSLVVLEVALSDTSGYDVCRALRERLGDRIAILFTSHDRTGSADRVAGLLLGADDYLAKPLRGDELLACVQRELCRVRARRISPPVRESVYLDDRGPDIVRRLRGRGFVDGN